MKNIAFIGLGCMGLHMAKNLIDNGYKVYGFDMSLDQLNKHQNNGGIAAKSIKEACGYADAIILSLPGPNQVSNVCDSSDGILKIAKAGTIIIDTSTIDANTSVLLAKKAKQNNLHMLDAPVSGGIIGAQNATLTFMVGGDKEIFERCKNLFNSMGKKYLHVGDNGKGLIIKLINNMLLGINMIAASEACNFAEKTGINLKTFYDIVASSTGSSWAFNKNFPMPDIIENVPANNDYKPGFGAPLIMKDINIAVETAQNYNINLKLGLLAKEIYERMINSEELNKKDFSAVIKVN
ncbi:3-hydroxyisobutyrate dehydrogenase [Francisella tularensis subsp. novicida]|uniref:3-hydroxyisobutyrate dehydrogenase n=1 Tax=Francisella tularensis TaxID=263 RepID=UPI0005023613|nr:3-hydroxyisobutyrate dehydrogenase [Francisella tularensis]AJJ47470.1 3-hydroxyisobutyrate dehydrogenase [Francisella tularensis subsp. novicida]KFJ69628.1 3-hydroxyisobutyrate dehydrogenase [Francisella tularensis subsp. novicida]MBK2345000.1 3-hydroxyisobutyrate dehydrogenase [Francisella tularensis subsp. novicida]MBK2350312.1 3-hydroxyisobutyrate dehydrogenase [Francisella tularensis subsp. novicida]MBK2353872.1 3-hydroxyisobutyrate dehydrogenase [Francisella tularensis subsp. novicida]